MTVGELAQQLGISDSEAVALCTASGIPVSGVGTKLSSADVAHVQDVLAGRAPMIDPRAATAGGGGGGLSGKAVGIAACVGIGVLLLVGLATAGNTVLGGGNTDINVSAGDCFDADLLFGGAFGSGIQRTSCSDGEYRAYAVIDLDEVFDSWPGEEAVSKHGEERCGVLAEGRVEAEGMFVEYYYFGPGTELAWDNEASHKIVCADSN